MWTSFQQDQWSRQLGVHFPGGTPNGSWKNQKGRSHGTAVALPGGVPPGRGRVVSRGRRYPHLRGGGCGLGYQRRDATDLGPQGQRGWPKLGGPRNRRRNHSRGVGAPAGGERPAARRGEGMAARTGDPAPGSRLFCAGDEVKTCRWDFISTHRSEFGVQRLCRVLGASRSGYYRHLATADVRTERAAEEAATVARIRRIHSEHRGGYGAPRIHAELRELGVCINRKRVTRLMREHHIVGRHLRRGRRTTIPDQQAATVPDLVGRDFTAEALDTRWCGDITYIPVGSSWLY